MEIQKKQIASFKHNLTKIIFGYYNVSYKEDDSFLGRIAYNSTYSKDFIIDFVKVMKFWNNETDKIREYLEKNNIKDKDFSKLFKKCPFRSDNRLYNKDHVKKIRKYCKKYLKYFYDIHVTNGEGEKDLIMPDCDY